MTITEFLLARIAEDEAAAHAATASPWVHGITRTGEPGRWRGIANYSALADRSRLGIDEHEVVADSPSEQDVEHIVRWDPARVLAECAAKRRIMELIGGWRHEVVEDCWYTCAAATEDRDGGECCDDNRRGTGCDCGRDHRAHAILALLALPYADHDDYREEWRP